MPLEKARLKEVDPRGLEVNPDRWVTVQFNPETLKVTYTNQVAQGSPRAREQQHVGPGATKLAVQLWFDVSAASGGEGAQALPEDVRELTERVVYFITPKQEGRAFVPPVMRFAWGTFQFDGVVESLDESLEFFSAEGRPLRAGVSLSLSQPRIRETLRNPDGAGPRAGAGSGRAPAGTAPLTAAPQGASVQRMTGQRNGGDSSGWRDVAEANGVEDPLRLPAGALLDLSAARGRG